MNRLRKNLLLSLILVIMIFLVGCSEDSFVRRIFSGESNRTSFIEGVKGPRQVIINQESRKFEVDASMINEEATGEEISYQWLLTDPDLAEFTEPNKAESTVIGKRVGKTSVRVKVDGVLSDRIPFEVLGEENKSYYGVGVSQFHSIVPTQDNTRSGYLAVGFDTFESVRPYVVKANNQGMTIWEGPLKGEGRIYGVQDVVYPVGGDKYYLIGYSKINGDLYEGYIAKVDNKASESGGPIVEQNFIGDNNNGDVYLRNGVAIKDGDIRYTDIIVVGNYDINNENVVPYISKVTINEEGEDLFTHRRISDDNIRVGEELSSRDYYNLESITMIGRDDQPEKGYLIAGFAGERRNDSDGILMKLDESLEVQWTKEISNDQLYNIKKLDDGNFMVAGVNGYIAILDEYGNIKSENNISNVGTFRDVEKVGDYYILVSESGYAVKVDFALNKASDFGMNGKAKLGDIFMGITNSTDGGYYLLAGRKDDKSYVVKIDEDGAVADRIID